jgi:hypothetical protein
MFSVEPMKCMPESETMGCLSGRSRVCEVRFCVGAPTLLLATDNQDVCTILHLYIYIYILFDCKWVLARWQ